VGFYVGLVLCDLARFALRRSLLILVGASAAVITLGETGVVGQEPRKKRWSFLMVLPVVCAKIAFFASRLPGVVFIPSKRASYAVALLGLWLVLANYARSTGKIANVALVVPDGAWFASGARCVQSESLFAQAVGNGGGGCHLGGLLAFTWYAGLKGDLILV
tara:strand:+ start:76 stop:561 length:486 start_codon:yes stop_codon:yes gene_type:complete